MEYYTQKIISSFNTPIHKDTKFKKHFKILTEIFHMLRLLRKTQINVLELGDFEDALVYYDVNGKKIKTDFKTEIQNMTHKNRTALMKFFYQCDYDMELYGFSILVYYVFMWTIVEKDLDKIRDISQFIPAWEYLNIDEWIESDHLDEFKKDEWDDQFIDNCKEILNI